MFIFLWIGLLLIMFSLISGFFILFKIPYISSQKLDDTAPIPTISIIIPVRNEEKNIVNLLDTLNKQSLQPQQVIIVDDESTDHTVEVASKYNVEIKIKNRTQNEEELVGKTAACYRGAIGATGELMIFMDADTFFDHEDALRNIIAEFKKLSYSGLFTIQPYHRTVKFYEKLSAPMNMVVVAGLNSFTPLKNVFKTGGAFGPFLMCSAKEYTLTGGHKEILGSHLDNFMLTKLFQDHNLSVYNFGGKGSVSFRMYPEGLKQWLLGWSKSIASGSSNTHPLIMSAVGLWIAGGLIIPLSIVFSLLINPSVWLPAFIFLYFFYAGQFLWLAQKVGKFSNWLFMCYPMLLVSFIIVYSWSFIQVHILHSVSWRDRKIDV